MENELLTGILTKIHNKTSEEISELLYDKSDDSDEVTLKEGALDLVLELDATRVEKLKSSAKPDKDELKSIRDRTIKEVMEDFEKKLKGKYGIESTSRGLDLVQEVVNTISECDISDDKVKTHPLYLDLEKTRTTDDYDALHTEYEEFKLNQDRTTRLGRIESDVLGIFANLNPIESQNPVVAQTHRKDFLKKFKSYDYELKDDGDHLILQNGSRLEDKHGNPIKFFDFVKGVAALNYDFAVSTDKGQAGNTRGNGSGSRVDVPKDEKEYLSLMTDLMQKGDKEGQQKLYKAWQESKNR